MKTIRENQEEVHLQGPEGPEDIRIIQSYPSKVCTCSYVYVKKPVAAGIFMFSYLYVDVYAIFMFSYLHTRHSIQVLCSPL
jgi:hypothetical protein